MEAKPISKQHDVDDGVSLPEDIIFDVLVRLPAKALCRFRSVSRAWRALISDPAFIAAQRSRAGGLIVGVFGSSRLADLELRVLDMHGNILRVFEARDSALVELTQLGRLICVDGIRRGAMIVDPAAGRAITAGRNDDDDSTWGHSSFGRATPSGACKVLRLHQPVVGVSYCQVATITDGGAIEPTWRQRALPPLVIPCSFSEHKATVNGVLYFMPFYSTYLGAPGGNRIAAFNLESEVWMETINGPPLGLEVGHREWRIALTELKGTLCVVRNIQGPSYVGPFACIWRLIDSSKSVWVKTYMIPLLEECLHIKPFDVLDDGRILLLNASCSRYILQFFDPSTKAFTDIMEMAEGFTGTMTFYTGSLLSS